ncbi:MAG: Bacterial aa3 type cytochrome c oxidase subunit, partial [Pseudomonadota bacterium]
LRATICPRGTRVQARHSLARCPAVGYSNGLLAVDASEKRSSTSDMGRSMAVDFKDGHPAMDYREHERTYAGFIRGTIVLTVICALILIGMALYFVG